ncbi:hypothetical protein [Bacillus sp. EAC]|uniref:hypothetical protein n=1 Tax=Bacillus sp. EAC TaxID=1978338 RepID=UPI001C4F9AFF|nr:hypothetical protein [Bacillus sp. EAC]
MNNIFPQLTGALVQQDYESLMRIFLVNGRLIEEESINFVRFVKVFIFKRFWI